MNPRQFIQTAQIDDTALSAQGIAFSAMDVIDLNNLPNGVVTGTTLLDLSKVPSPNVRAGITMSMLFAHLAAKGARPSDQDKWLEEYVNSLSQLGFGVSGTALVNQQFPRMNVSVHEALVPVLTIAFGGATVGPVILGLLNNLKNINSDSPWITLYNHETKRFDVCEMHFAAATSTGTQTEIRYAIARLHIETSVTQVLFFKINMASANYQSLTTTMFADDSLMAVCEEDLRKRLSDLVRDYIKKATL
jgi:hypothetical protein